MIDRQKTKPRRPREQGAALIIAIAIMTILLAVGLTFYAISRQQVANTVNLRNQVQADLLTDAALAMAQAELNRDFMKHPNATSLDAAPFSLFDGSWAVGKQWALRNGASLQSGGVPLVNLSAMPFLDFGDGLPAEQMFSGSRSKDWLTIPRFEGATPLAYANVLDDGTGLPYANIFDITSPNRAPFVTPAYYGPSLTDGGATQKYPLEWINTWTDVDNDGDGLKDAIWIPLPQDKFFSGGEYQDDLRQYQYDDGIDNDLDAAPHILPNARPGDPPVLYDERPEAGEGAMELGTFVYWGGADGLDNDGDGTVDEPGAYATGGEQDYFLTAPITGIQVYLDFNADGVVPDLVPDSAGVLRPLVLTVRPGNVTVQTKSGPVTLPETENNHVDAIDNDYDMLINDYQVYAYVGPNSLTGAPFMISGFKDTGVPDGAGGTVVTAIENASATNANPSMFGAAKSKSYEQINIAAVLGAPGTVFAISPATGTFYSDTGGPRSTYDYEDVLRPLIVFTHSGEPVCDLAGRAAITIRDESSKVNMNVAGGHQYDPLLPIIPAFVGPGKRLDALRPAIYRSLGLGTTPAEYETRTLPTVGVVESAQYWLQRTGVPGGNPTSWDASAIGIYGSDIIYPGYGRVDDNANVMLAALNGRDDDGDGLVDEGLFLPKLSALAEAFLRGAPLSGAQIANAQQELLRTRYPEYFAQLGVFEGIDEPGELQRYQPLPNLEAEGRNPFHISGPLMDGLDNDGNGVINERGELGDLQLQDPLQITDVLGIGTGTYGTLRQSITTFSTDRNVNFVGGTAGIRAINKLDYNFATPQQIAANLVLSNNFESVTARPVATLAATDPRYLATNRFAEGLKQGDIHIRSRQSGLMWVPDGATSIPTVPFFAADPVLQAMQAAVDIVDNRDPGHGRSTLTTERMLATPPSDLEAGLYDFFPASLSARERVAESDLFPLRVLEDQLKTTLDETRKLEIRDDWWTFEAGVRGVDGQPEKRDISYTVSGNEAIKINEIMVRAVRRIEAEAVTSSLLADDPMADPIVPATTPLSNFDPTPYDVGGNPSILPQFSVDREAQPNWLLNNGGFLGATSYLTATTSSDVLEFTINATDGLPGGRYYLTVNTTTANGTPTVVPMSQLPAPFNLGFPILQSAVKYRHRTAGGQRSQTIIQDVLSLPLPGIDHFQDILDPQIANAVPGAPGGWAFVDGTRNGIGEPDGYHYDGLPADPLAVPTPLPSTGPAPGVQTFTITVPPVGSSYELHIAFRMNPSFVTAVAGLGLNYTVAINSLDFSQEPDHEWMELVNVSDDTVNIGGWEMEVGIPDKPSVPSDPFKSTWTIPAGTEIAPRGMVLLAFSKFDRLQVGPGSNRIAANGMGLADGHSPNPLLTGGLLTGNLTVPIIADNSVTSTVPALQDLTGSVFRRLTNPVTNQLTDYVDWDGDGRTALNAPQDTDNLANDGVVASSKELGSLLSSTGGNLPWDRIIQLEENSRLTSDTPFTTPTAKRLSDVDTLDDVAALVLRGGVFPNYPEHDGIDNDGDGGYVEIANPDGLGLRPIYFAGTLDRDMVDNNRNGFVDERGTAQDGDADNDFDFYGLLATDLGDGVNPLLSEGVDEGAGVGAGEYLPGTLDFVFYTNRSLYPTDNDYAISDSDTTVGPLREDVVQGGKGIDLSLGGLPVANPNGITAPYIGSNADPADWKAFSERRWYPGDNVIVSLYAGLAIDGELVDRATYREYDVINRTIDDVQSAIANPLTGMPGYVAVDLNGDTIVQPNEFPGVNPNYPSMWLPNQMGLDFYRSLERKHPLYNGDKFGTTNRWEATDGNYDDWADSISFFEDDLHSDTVPAGTTPLLISANRESFVRPRFIAAHPLFPANSNTLRNSQLFGHAIYGTPLRMNTAARRSENPRDLELIAASALDPRQFPNPFSYFRTHEDGAFDPMTNNSPSWSDQRWNHSRTFVADRPYQNPGDLMRVPHQMYMHDAINTGDPAVGYLRDMTMLNYGLRGDLPANDSRSYMQDIALRGTSLGQDPADGGQSENILTAAINSMAVDTLVLTMGQAEFHPIRPAAADVSAATLDWVANGDTGLLDDRLAPAAWAPVFLFGLPSDGPRTNEDQFPNYPAYVNGERTGATIGLHYLFNTNYLTDLANFGGANVYNNNFQDRWPLETRTAMYVSERRNNPALAPPEALFTWDGADGLENGEYTVYIGTFLPKMRERLEDAARDAAQVRNTLVQSTPAITIAAKDNAALINLDETTPANNTGLELPDGSIVPVDPVAKALIAADPTNPGSAGQRFEPVYAIEIITDPTEARGEAPVTTSQNKPGGLIGPDEWNPTIQYKAGPDGYIFYGNNAAGGWQPQIVRVTDNFLALRVRNLGAQGQVGALTHIVLAPRKRTAGRVNVNTVQSRIASFPQAGPPTSQQYFNTLLGLPGVADAATSVLPSTGLGYTAPMPADDDVALMTSTALPPGGAWTPPAGFYAFAGLPILDTPPSRNGHNSDPPTNDSDLLVPDALAGTSNRHTLGAFRLSSMLMAGRTEHADGRYYESVGSLADNGSAFDFNFTPFVRADRPDLSTGTLGVESRALYPLSNESLRSRRFDEVQARIGSIGNLVSTRSDVFEITMTVEAGYGVDKNNDGFLNYRDPNEFVTTATTKASAVYERRAPSDSSDSEK